jgi:Zinc-binding dehydrogenase
MARSTVEPRLPRPTFEAPNRRRSTTRLHDVLEDGSLTPIVAHTFPLEQVPDAIAFLASGRAHGRGRYRAVRREQLGPRRPDTIDAVTAWPAVRPTALVDLHRSHIPVEWI